MSDSLLCLFSATIEETDDKYVVEVPRREIDVGAVTVDTPYRVALLSHDQQEIEDRRSKPGQPQPPVEVGETRYVEIEDLGKQGDGIARVERGYVIIVPDVSVGDRVKVEILEVKPNFAVGESLDGA